MLHRVPRCFSTKSVLHGLYFQDPDRRGKLVQVLQCEVFDVALDIKSGKIVSRVFSEVRR